MKSITIVTIDSLHYQTTAWAIDWTRKFLPDSPVLTLGARPYYPDSTFVRTGPFNHQGHSELCLHAVAPHITTDYALFIQWDGMPTQADQWDDKFLTYDYIGAPWPGYHKDQNVGNGGLSLRSKRLMDAVAAKYNEYSYNKHGPEDQWICKYLRPELEQQGMKFPTGKVAERFSVEHPVDDTRPCWGFHGEWHAQPRLKEHYAEWRRLKLTDVQLGKL